MEIGSYENVMLRCGLNSAGLELICTANICVEGCEFRTE